MEVLWQRVSYEDIFDDSSVVRASCEDISDEIPVAMGELRGYIRC